VSLAALVFAAAAAHPDLDRVESMVIEGTNQFRASQGLATLSPEARLERAARAFANHLADGGAFSHESGGTTPEMRVTSAGYGHCVVAENLARHYDTAGFTTAQLARKLVQAWKDSPGHRKNMLDPDSLETAVAVVSRRRERYEEFYAVQLLALSDSKAVQFRVRNRAGFPITYRVNGRQFTLDPNWGRGHKRCAGGDVLFEGRARGRFQAGRDECLVVRAGGEVKSEPGTCN
jgi:hypothetical protein